MTRPSCIRGPGGPTIGVVRTGADPLNTDPGPNLTARSDAATAAAEDDRRGQPRRLVWAAAVARPLGLKAHPVHVHVTNLSNTGVGFTARRPLWPGQGITLTLSEDAGPTAPVLTYQIVYCHPVEKGFVMGAELVR